MTTRSTKSAGLDVDSRIAKAIDLCDREKLTWQDICERLGPGATKAAQRVLRAKRAA